MCLVSSVIFIYVLIVYYFKRAAFSRTLKSYEFGLISGILVFMTIVNLVYKSNLAAVFIKPPLLIPFESVHQVAYQEAIPLRAAGGSYAASVILVILTKSFIDLHPLYVPY